VTRPAGERAIDEAIDLTLDLALRERPELRDLHATGSASATLGRVRTFAEPVSRN
jgi:hypothetical protein